MFELTLYDSKGIKLHIGDIVKVEGNNEVTFYTEVKWLEKEKAISPFHTFCFHSIEKVDGLPKNAQKSESEDRFDLWYTYPDSECKRNVEQYLSGWRECENLLEKRCFRIELIR